MKFIRKTSEPSSFTEWKLRYPDKKWGDFKPLQERNELRDTLLEEQGYICCYCEREIDQARGHFEHLLPRSYRDENGTEVGHQKELDYENIVFSCTKFNKPINEEDDRTTCGHEKGDWYDEKLFVSPLNADCESYFRYLNNGTIVPANDSKEAQETIQRLKLNGESLGDELFSNLVLRRKKVIDAAWEAWEECKKNPSKMAMYAELELKRKANGRFDPFWTTMRQVFQEILGLSWTCPE